MANSHTKIIVLVQRTEDENEVVKYLEKLSKDLYNVLGHDYYLIQIIYDEENLTLFDSFPVVLYTFPDGSYLQEHDPAKLLGMEWVSECTIEDGAIQRLFVAHSKAEGDKPERIMLCTFPFGKVSHTIQQCSRVLLNWFLLTQKGKKNQ